MSFSPPTNSKPDLVIAVEAINDRKIGLEKFDAAPFFGNEQQAFSLKKEAVVAGAPQSYSQGLKFLYFLTKIFGHFYQQEFLTLFGVRLQPKLPLLKQKRNI